MPAGLTKGFLNELQAAVADGRIGYAVNETLDSIVGRISQHLDQPMRLFQTAAGANAVLNFGTAEVQLGDGAGRSVPPISDLIPTTVAGTLNFQSGATTGLTFQLDGGTFSVFPTSTIGKFRRVVFLLQSDGSVNMHFSAEQTTLAATDNPGALLSGLDGLAIGWLDLVATGTTAFKTVGSSTSVIEANPTGSLPTIHRFGSGGGGGSGSALPLRLQSASDPSVTLSGDYFRTVDNREITTWDGLGTDTSNYGKNLSFNATTQLGAGTVGSTVYHFYIDLTLLAAEVTIATGKYAGRKVYPISSSSLPIFITTTAPEQINRARYQWRGSIKTTSGGGWSGTGASLMTAGNLQGYDGPVAINPRVASLAKQVIGSVGSVGQIAGGHALSAKSWPATLGATNLSYYNLAANINDGSGNARALTNNGATPFTATNIFGAAGAAALNGTTQYFSSTAAFFNPGNGVSFACGGWFKATNWGATQALFSNQQSGTDRAFDILNFGSSLNLAGTNTAASADVDVLYPHGFVNGTWHHIAMVYDFTAQLIKLYADGKVVLSTTLANVRSSTSTNFQVGAHQLGSNPFTGSIEDVFFVNGYRMTDADIRKLASSRLDHNANVSASNQFWTGGFYSGVSGCATQDESSWLICKNDANSLFYDLSDMLAADSAELFLDDKGLNATYVPSKPPFDTIFSSNPTFPLAHGLADVPVVQILKEVVSGEWETISAEGLVQATSTNFVGTLQTLFTDGALRVRLRGVVGNDPTGVSTATPTNAGIIPQKWTRYNKVIGAGGQYGDFAAAGVVAGDSVLVIGDVSAAAQVLISADDVRVDFEFGARLISTVTGAAPFKASGNRFKSDYIRVRADGALTSGFGLLELTGSDFGVLDGYLEQNNAAQALTNAVVISGTGRGKLESSVVSTTGAYTNIVSDSGTSNSNVELRGT